jgi:LDH2 family malate/lactate/ureidoglycolate dehydrogenase
MRLNIRRPFLVAACMQDCIQHRTDEGKDAAMGEQRYAPEALRAFGTRVLDTLGVPSADAFLVADSLVQADLWGHGSHGMLRLPWYAARLRSGAMAAVTQPATLVDTGPLLLLDGRDGVGQVLTERARVLAVERARTHGIGAVGVRNSNHFGTAMWFTRRAARDGVVAVLTTNASPAMAPWGGRQKVLGTNPWSIAAPAPGGRVVAVDIANTAVARGKIYLAKNRGEPIPDTWALTADGAPTTDPAEGVLGVVLPMAGHKGYAITFLMDVLSGALTGSGVGTEVHGPYEPEARSRAGHLFLAIDPAALGDPAEYEARVQRLIDEVKGVPLARGFDEVFYPGEVEDRAEAANLAAGGVVLAAESVAELRRLGEETGIRFGEERS